MQRIIAYFFVPTCLMTSIVSSVAIAPNNESAIGPQLSAFWIKSHIKWSMRHFLQSKSELGRWTIHHKKKLSILNKVEGSTINTKSIKLTGICV